jgi:endogenous inhibitor of DNA gyrase (YacG/DUF329 family)
MCKPIYINEASYERKYKCMYCETKLAKEKLVDHIDDAHTNLIPSGYTAARLVFNTVNKKEKGSCVICGKETPWNENTWRYDRFCCETCRKKAADLAAANLKKKTGKTKEDFLKDPEFQNKMLKGRSISGTYKFTHGGALDYVGTYEKKFLEFCDKVLNLKASEIMAPGPTVEYMYNNEKHFWITDFMIVPFNLVIDVKDGGDNPNNREMASYREKQHAKEFAIIDSKKYNYLRLTDNDFSQLMEAFMEIKLQMMNHGESGELVIKINESEIPFGSNYVSVKKLNCSSIKEYSSAVMGAIVANRSAYIVPYLKKNTFEMDFAVTDDPNLERLLVKDEFDRVIPKGYNFLKENAEKYDVFRYDKPVQECDFEPSNLFELVTGKRLMSEDQIYYDDDFERVTSRDRVLEMVDECMYSSLKGSDYKIPVVNEGYIVENNLMFYQDSNGYFVENPFTECRSASYKSLDMIPKDMIKYISEGVL